MIIEVNARDGLDTAVKQSVSLAWGRQEFSPSRVAKNPHAHLCRRSIGGTGT